MRADHRGSEIEANSSGRLRYLSVRLSGPAAMLAGVVLLSVRGRAAWLAAFPILISIPGLHTVQKGRDGKLGAWSAAVASVGAFGLSLGALFHFLSIFSLGAKELLRGFSEEQYLGPSGLILGLALVAFGLRSIRAKFFPKTPLILLASSVVLFGLGGVTLSREIVLPFGIRLSQVQQVLIQTGLAGLGVAFVWLGFRSWRSRERDPASQESRRLLPAVGATLVVALFSGMWITLENNLLASKETLDRVDDVAGPQIHLIYALPRDRAGRFGLVSEAIERWVTRGQRWFRSETDGASLRFDSFEGRPDITYLRLTTGFPEMEAIKGFLHYEIVAQLEERGLGDREKVWVTLVDSKKVTDCGFAQDNHAFIFLDDSCFPGLSNTRVESRIDFTILHEILHTLGHVSRCAPHVSEKHAHVTDDLIDLMSHQTQGGLKRRLDKDRDDYYGHSKEACPDLADSSFLHPMPRDSQHPWWFKSDPIVDAGFELDDAGGFSRAWMPSELRGGLASRDGTQSRSGSHSARLSAEPTASRPYADIVQCFGASKFRGRFLRFGGYLKTEDVTHVGASIYMVARAWRGSLDYRDTFQEVQGPEGHQHLVGTNDWKLYSDRMFIPQVATNICVGIDLDGSGTVFADDLFIDVIS